MKNLNFLFVLFFGFVVKSNAQQINDQRFIKQESVMMNMSSSSISDESMKLKESNREVSLSKEVKTIVLGEKQFVTKNNDVLKVATPVKVNRVEGIPASITNQPLKRYNEDLIPVKVK